MDSNQHSSKAVFPTGGSVVWFDSNLYYWSTNDGIRMPAFGGHLVSTYLTAVLIGKQLSFQPTYAQSIQDQIYVLYSSSLKLDLPFCSFLF